MNQDQPSTDKKTARRRWRLRWWHVPLLLALWLAVELAPRWIESARYRAMLEKYRSENRERPSSETISYNPETRKTNVGDFVFIALGRSVLKVPADELTNIRGMSPERYAELPEPPDANEPEGWPDHPMRGSGFSFAYRYKAVLRNKFDPQQPPGTPSQLSVVAARPDEWGMQLNRENWFEAQCQRKGMREKLPNGLIACRVQPNDKTIPASEWAVSYRAKPEIYTAPLGRPFIVDCWPAGSNGVQPCKVRYKLNDAFNVFYEFFPSNVPIADIIDFDRDLRARIQAAVVEKYVWPEGNVPADPPSTGDPG